jgi:hypothetical protein
MTEPVWIDLEVVLAIHDEQVSEHGGLADEQLTAWIADCTAPVA